MISVNVVQLGAGNVHGTAAEAAQMDLRAGEKCAMGAMPGRDGIEGVDQGGEAADGGSTDSESVVLDSQCVDRERVGAVCHIPRNKSGEDRQGAELGAAENLEGGRGSVCAGGRGVRIGFEHAENFSNVLVEAAAVVGKARLIARVVKTGQIVLVDVVGVDATELQLPCYLTCQQKKKGGGLVFAGPVPAWRCPQCRIASPVDCLEQPCGWDEKRKGARELLQ